jgi:hypothetical protein
MLTSRNPVATMRRSVPVRKSVWGPYLWRFFHAVGHQLTHIEDLKTRCDKTRALWTHTKSLIQAIPCPSCRGHALTEYTYTKYIEPGDDNCDWYQKWAFNFHNKVNKRLRKPIMSWDNSIKLSESLNAVSQLQGYVQSINGWRFPRMEITVTAITSILESL